MFNYFQIISQQYGAALPATSYRYDCNWLSLLPGLERPKRSRKMALFRQNRDFWGCDSFLTKQSWHMLYLTNLILRCPWMAYPIYCDRKMVSNSDSKIFIFRFNFEKVQKFKKWHFLPNLDTFALKVNILIYFMLKVHFWPIFTKISYFWLFC